MSGLGTDLNLADLDELMELDKCPIRVELER